MLGGNGLDTCSAMSIETIRSRLTNHGQSVASKISSETDCGCVLLDQITRCGIQVTQLSADMYNSTAQSVSETNKFVNRFKWRVKTRTQITAQHATIANQSKFHVSLAGNHFSGNLPWSDQKCFKILDPRIVIKGKIVFQLFSQYLARRSVMELQNISKEVVQERFLKYRIKFDLKPKVSRFNSLKIFAPYPRSEFSKINWTQMNKTVLAICRKAHYSVEYKHYEHDMIHTTNGGANFWTSISEMLYQKVILLQHRGFKLIQVILYHTTSIPTSRWTTKRSEIYINIHKRGIATRRLVAWIWKVKRENTIRICKIKTTPTLNLAHSLQWKRRVQILPSPICLFLYSGLFLVWQQVLQNLSSYWEKGTKKCVTTYSIVCNRSAEEATGSELH